MTVHVHHLTGCSPVPLAHYLKALGILRLVAEQRDLTARGWWRDESFHLATTLDENELLRFFLDEYRPTPLIAPWNGGSGFYPKDNKQGIAAIRQSQAERFECYRSAIKQGEAVVADLTESPKGETKNILLRHCRHQWRGPLLEWFEAAVVLTGDGEPGYPALLGTGGNDGRLDFTSNFMQRLAELFRCDQPHAPAREPAASLLNAAIFKQPTAGLVQKAVGQFLPGGAGGANSNTGFGGNGQLNPWDFVLMLEGAVLFAASVVRRAQARALPQAAAPFAVPPQSVGYGSASVADEFSKYKTTQQKPGHGEQWMPLWGRPASLVEIRALIAEGRSQIGSRPAQRPLDFGRAIARLGVARGITAFQRYGYIERNGQANLAVPLGRWNVQAQPHQNLIDQVAGWADRLRRAGSDQLAPTSVAVGRAARACEEAILACCRNGRSPQRWQDLLMTLGAAEAQLPHSPRFAAKKRLQPLPELGTAWLAAANDGSAELRLALALASQHGAADGYPTDSIRRHFLPLDKGQRRFLVANESLVNTADIVCTADDLQTVCIALVRRRIVEAGQRGLSHLPLMPVKGAGAPLEDMVRLMAGELDEMRILSLARPLMALDWRKFHAPWERARPTLETLGALGLYGLFRLAHPPGPLR
ncbi:MAG: type I-U CRISPR-associated protein Csx17, partial [Anaerolineaceae bacterium]|nr:type I-U CRISPR-associated protein Csx17 [Anaerolineaceae bacterium]